MTNYFITLWKEEWPENLQKAAGYKCWTICTRTKVMKCWREQQKTRVHGGRATQRKKESVKNKPAAGSCPTADRSNRPVHWTGLC